MATARLLLGDCLDILPTLEAASVDCVITDPPYPCIDRAYGRWSEAEWFAMMRVVVPECMRILKPTGSAVFILQPNSERVGRMRTWLWEFMAWVGKEWGIVQDAWWWNPSTLPLAGATTAGLLRPSLKLCAWLGPPDCYRCQDAVLLSESENNRRDRLASRFTNVDAPSRRRTHTEGDRDNMFRLRTANLARGGATPFNVLPVGSGSAISAGKHGHGAGTPLALCSWWTRYLCPPGGVVLDPFSGTATVGLAAGQHGCDYIGIERDAGYHAIAQRRLAEAESAAPLFEGPHIRQDSLFTEMTNATKH